MNALLTNYQALLALLSNPLMTPVMRGYLTDVLREHREMREALIAISGLDTIRGVNAAERKGLQMAVNLARAALTNTEGNA